MAKVCLVNTVNGSEGDVLLLEGSSGLLIVRSERLAVSTPVGILAAVERRTECTYQGAKNSTSISGLPLTASSNVAAVSFRTSEGTSEAAASARANDAKARKQAGVPKEEKRMVKMWMKGPFS